MISRTAYDDYVETEENAQGLLVPPLTPGRDHIAGSPDAPVQLVEFGDYECPYCGLAHPIVHSLQRELGPRLAFAYRHFPLSNVHPHARMAAEAAEAAGGQGKFWPMHDMLFRNQAALDERSLLAYAIAIGLDEERFGRDLESGVHAARVEEDIASGIRSGVQGTPAFFINGVRHEGSWRREDLLAALLAAETATTARR